MLPTDIMQTKTKIATAKGKNEPKPPTREVAGGLTTPGLMMAVRKGHSEKARIQVGTVQGRMGKTGDRERQIRGKERYAGIR